MAETITPRRALICGISGQDGAYLAALLLEKGYKVCGTSRDAQVSPFRGLTQLGIRERVHVESMTLTDFRSVLQVLTKFEPDEVYNLAGQSSVGLSFQQPVETLESIATGTLNLLEAIRFMARPVRMYNAGSSECFGETLDAPANEQTALRPRSPYAVAKATAYWEVANYREAYGLFACSGMLFNHESPLRPERFVTKKVVASAVRIARGSPERLRLGDVSVQRDWGWAPEYVDAMWRMMQLPSPQDFVIATGESHSLQAFVSTTFACLDMDWRDHVEVDDTLRRPSDIRVGRGDPAKAAKILGWTATLHMREVVAEMVAAELEGAAIRMPAAPAKPTL
jgi:GDPmannose 4,6-dehydratase